LCLHSYREDASGRNEAELITRLVLEHGAVHCVGACAQDLLISQL
jgi:hypothetical protein